MPRFFFHLRDSVEVLLDEEGSVMAPEAVAGRALTNARDIMAHDARQGRINLAYALEVADEGGRTVHRLDFGEAVEIVGATFASG